MTRVKHLLSSEALPEPPVPVPRQSLWSLYSHSTCASPARLPHTGSRGTLGTQPTTETTTFLLSPLQLLSKVLGTLQPSINFSWGKKKKSMMSLILDLHRCHFTARLSMKPVFLNVHTDIYFNQYFWDGKRAAKLYSLPKS